MKHILIATLLLLAVVNAVKTEQEIFTEVSQQNEFGNAVTSFIQMQASVQAPSGRLNAINTELNKIKNVIEAQQTKETERHDQKVIECNTTLAEITTQISRLTTTQADNKGEKDALDLELTEKTQLVSEKRDALVTDQRNLEEYKTQKSDAQTKYNSYKQNFEEAITLCENALRLLEQIVRNHGAQEVVFAQNGQMLVQLSQKFDGIKKMLDDKAQGTQSAFIEPIIDVLVQMGTSQHIDIAQVEQIIELINRLIARLRQGLSNEESNIQSQITSFNTLIEQLTTSTRTQSSQITTLEERITAIQQRSSDLSTTITNTESVITVTTGLKGDLVNDCQIADQNYREGTLSRSGQIEILAKLIKYFNEQVVTSTTAVNDGAYNDNLGAL